MAHFVIIVLLIEYRDKYIGLMWVTVGKAEMWGHLFHEIKFCVEISTTIFSKKWYMTKINKKTLGTWLMY